VLSLFGYGGRQWWIFLPLPQQGGSDAVFPWQLLLVSRDANGKWKYRKRRIKRWWLRCKVS